MKDKSFGKWIYNLKNEYRTGFICTYRFKDVRNKYLITLSRWRNLISDATRCHNQHLDEDVIGKNEMSREVKWTNSSYPSCYKYPYWVDRECVICVEKRLYGISNISPNYIHILYPPNNIIIVKPMN